MDERLRKIRESEAKSHTAMYSDINLLSGTKADFLIGIGRKREANLQLK